MNNDELSVNSEEAIVSSAFLFFFVLLKIFYFFDIKIFLLLDSLR